MSWLKCEYLQDRVGEEFDGVISAVTGFGLFVELKDVYVEGLIHVTSLPHDYYHHEVAQHRMVGERTNQVFRLGDELRVQVARVNLDERKIDFILVEGNYRKSPKKKTKTATRTKKSDAEQQASEVGERKIRKRKIKTSSAAPEEKSSSTSKKPAAKKASSDKKKVKKKEKKKAVKKLAKKSAKKKVAVKKPASKKPAAKKSAVKKSAGNKVGAKKTTAKKTSTKKSSPKK